MPPSTLGGYGRHYRDRHRIPSNICNSDNDGRLSLPTASAYYRSITVLLVGWEELAAILAKSPHRMVTRQTVTFPGYLVSCTRAQAEYLVGGLSSSEGANPQIADDLLELSWCSRRCSGDSTKSCTPIAGKHIITDCRTAIPSTTSINAPRLMSLTRTLVKYSPAT